MCRTFWMIPITCTSFYLIGIHYVILNGPSPLPFPLSNRRNLLPRLTVLCWYCSIKTVHRFSSIILRTSLEMLQCRLIFFFHQGKMFDLINCWIHESESKGENYGNLHSQPKGKLLKRLIVKPAFKRSAVVAPEVNLRNQLHTGDKADPSWLWIQSRRHQEVQKRCTSGPTKWTFWKNNFLMPIFYDLSSGSRIWSRGGPRIFFRDFAYVAKRSLVSKANNIIFQYKRIWEFWQICSFF